MAELNKTNKLPVSRSTAANQLRMSTPVENGDTYAEKTNNIAMNKQQSFDPSLLPKRGIFRGKTAYSFVGQPDSTKSLESRRPHSSFTEEKYRLIVINKPQTPHSLRATTATSLSAPRTETHKPGQIPAYMGKTNKYSIESELNAKRNKFATLKRKLIQDQTEIMELHRAINEMQKKANKLSGKHTPVEKIELIVCTANDINSNVWVKTNGIRQNSPILSEDVPRCIDQSKLHSLKQQIHEMHSANLTLNQTLKDEIHFQFSQFKETASDKDQNIQNFLSNNDAFFKNLETSILKTETEQQKGFSNCMKELQHIKSKASIKERLRRAPSDIVKEDPVPRTNDKTIMAAAAAKEQELKMDIAAKMSEIETLRNKCENSKLLVGKSQKQLEAVEQKVTDLKTQNLEINKKLSEHKLTIKELKSQEMLQKKRTENFNLQNQNQLKEIARISALLQKETEAKADLEHEFQMVKNALQTLEQQLADKSFEKALEDTDENAQGDTKFQDQLSKNEKFQSQIVSQQKTIKQQAIEIAKLNDKLKVKLGELEGEKNKTNSMESHEAQSLKQKMHSQEKTIRNQCAEINSLQNAIKTLHKKGHQSSAENDKQLLAENQLLLCQVKKHEESINRQNNSICALEDLVKNKSSELAEVSLKMHHEINRFQAIDLKKNEELTKLRKDLARTEEKVQEQEEALFSYEKMLHVRGELIKTLQQSDHSPNLAQSKITELYAELHNNSSMVNKMEHDVSTKRGELHNFFSTLSTKQVQVVRQDKIIEMLEANNEKCRRILNKQTEKILLLEQENATLRNLILKNAQSEVFDQGELLNQTLFDRQRRKKRSSQIIVKKYSC